MGNCTSHTAVKSALGQTGQGQDFPTPVTSPFPPPSALEDAMLCVSLTCYAIAGLWPGWMLHLPTEAGSRWMAENVNPFASSLSRFHSRLSAGYIFPQDEAQGLSCSCLHHISALSRQSSAAVSSISLPLIPASPWICGPLLDWSLR